MTATLTSPAVPTTAADRLRTVLREDGVVTAAVGVGTAVAAVPLAAELPGSPTVLRVLGALLVLAGVEVVLAARVRPDRLRLVGTVVGELALGWAAASTVVVLVAGAGAAVTAAVLAVAAVSVVFGVTELRLVRALER